MLRKLCNTNGALILYLIYIHRYNEPFSRANTYGEPTLGDKSGQAAKRCMTQCAGNVVIISKEQMDFIDRTYARLGRKLKKSVPEEISI